MIKTLSYFYFVCNIGHSLSYIGAVVQKWPYFVKTDCKKVFFKRSSCFRFTKVVNCCKISFLDWSEKALKGGKKHLLRVKRTEDALENATEASTTQRQWNN